MAYYSRSKKIKESFPPLLTGKISIKPKTNHGYYRNKDHVQIINDQVVMQVHGVVTLKELLTMDLPDKLDLSNIKINVWYEYREDLTPQQKTAIEQVNLDKKEEAKKKEARAAAERKRAKERERKRALRDSVSEEEQDLAVALSTLKKHGLKVVVVEDKQR